MNAKAPLIIGWVFYGDQLVGQGIDVGVGYSKNPVASYFHELGVEVA
jgi:hypothetical protein